MELFLEFCSVVVLTFSICFIIGKFTSWAPTSDRKDGGGKLGVCELESEFEDGIECDSGVDLGIRDLGSDGFVEKVLEVDEFVGEAVLGSLTVRVFLDEICGSSGIGEDFGVEEDEVIGGGEFVDEKLVEEESSGGYGGSFESEHNLLDESSERDKLYSAGKDEEEGASEVRESDGMDGLKEESLDDEDDWVGIERTELERQFGAAMAFVGSKSNADKISVLGSNLQMKLYGLYKIATQGPCLQPQPTVLKVCARAKWNAWQQLGKMSPETAMEQYISLLSDSIPGWKEDELVAQGDDQKDISDDGEVNVSKTSVDNQPNAGDDDR
ncbi:hypothetical protein UlMin_039072 [Ulmus minor]